MLSLEVNLIAHIVNDLAMMCIIPASFFSEELRITAQPWPVNMKMTAKVEWQAEENKIHSLPMVNNRTLKWISEQSLPPEWLLGKVFFMGVATLRQSCEMMRKHMDRVLAGPDGQITLLRVTNCRDRMFMKEKLSNEACTSLFLANRNPWNDEIFARELLREYPCNFVGMPVNLCNGNRGCMCIECWNDPNSIY